MHTRSPKISLALNRLKCIRYASNQRTLLIFCRTPHKIFLQPSVTLNPILQPQAVWITGACSAERKMTTNHVGDNLGTPRHSRRSLGLCRGCGDAGRVAAVTKSGAAGPDPCSRDLKCNCFGCNSASVWLLMPRASQSSQRPGQAVTALMPAAAFPFCSLTLSLTNRQDCALPCRDSSIKVIGRMSGKVGGGGGRIHLQDTGFAGPALS